jgi:hypothetical protein
VAVRAARRQGAARGEGDIEAQDLAHGRAHRAAVLLVVTAVERDTSTWRICGWCKASIRAAARRDSKFCSKRCRQASHRFRKPSRSAGATLSRLGGPARRFAYADPPYPGLARRYYADRAEFTGEIDHAELISRLGSSFDAWALSTSAEALPSILPLCPYGTRVAAWFRGERPTDSYSPLGAWEPVLYFGARHQPSRVDAGLPRRVDALVHVARPRLTDPRRRIGQKPAAFYAWLFQLLGAIPEDEFVDLFPASGGAAMAWEAYRSTAARHDGQPSRVATCDVSWGDRHATAPPAGATA